MQQHFDAYVVRGSADGTYKGEIEQRDVGDLPAGELLVAVSQSGLNYKDALSARGHRGVTKTYPHTPGIDAVGCVVEDATGRFPAGAAVLVTGHDLGMNTSGGWGERIRVPADWALPLPDGLSREEAAALGTAGLTAAMGVEALIDGGVTREDGDVLVTGATGGVGSLAIAILARLGYRVTAATGKTAAEPELRELGAAEVVGRDAIGDASNSPLLKGRWAGVLDGVGGETLADVLRTTQPRGIVASYGNAGGHVLTTTVYPFILRGVRLVGVDSAACPAEQRERLWGNLAGAWKPEPLGGMFRTVGLDELEDEIEKMLAGDARGRVVVEHGSRTA